MSTADPLRASRFPAMKKLYRIPREGKVAGVCAGLAEYFGIDPTAVRLLVVVLSILTTGATLVAYLAMVLLAPVKPD
jgi:phage shock protein C